MRTSRLQPAVVLKPLFKRWLTLFLQRGLAGFVEAKKLRERVRRADAVLYTVAADMRVESHTNLRPKKSS